MTLSIALVALAVTAAPAVSQPQVPTLEALRARAQERMRQDLSVYSREELRALEELYQSANRDLRSPTAKETLQRVLKEYPKSNRAGSAVLYLAQLSSGEEREAYLKSAIGTYGDTWYGDGVQVGALARAQLAMTYAATGRVDDAKVLVKEIEDKFPGAVDHGGRPLLDSLRRLR
jgi:hypothetical protein